MKIISKEILSNTPANLVTSFGILAPNIAQRALPGQFVVLMVSEERERIPLTVVSLDRLKGTSDEFHVTANNGSYERRDFAAALLAVALLDKIF